MKAKKFIVIAVLAAMGTYAQAQIVSSRSNQVIVHEVEKEPKPKKPRTIKWNIRAGYSYDYMTGGVDLSGRSGLDVSFGISKPFSDNGLFWGVEAGIMTYGAQMDIGGTLSWVIDLNPRIGIDFPLSKNLDLDIYFGPYIGFLPDGKGDYYQESSSYHRPLHTDEGIDIGINLGAELFISRNFFFDLHIKKGFMDSGKLLIHDASINKKIKSFKFVLGIGYQF